MHCCAQKKESKQKLILSASSFGTAVDKKHSKYTAIRKMLMGIRISIEKSEEDLAVGCPEEDVDIQELNFTETRKYNLKM